MKKKYLTEEALLEANRKYRKKWADKNKEKIKEIQKIYREKNKKRLSEAVKKSREKNKERYRNYNLKYWRKNKDKLIKVQKESRDLRLRKTIYYWNRLDPYPFWSRRLTFLKGECKRHNIKFDLDAEYLTSITFDQKFSCYYTGFFLQPSIGRRPITIEERLNRLSLDRKDPKKGYVYGNIVLVCDLVNSSKLNLNDHEFISFLRIITNRIKINKNFKSTPIDKYRKSNHKLFRRTLKKFFLTKNFHKSVKNKVLGRHPFPKFMPNYEIELVKKN